MDKSTRVMVASMAMEGILAGRQSEFQRISPEKLAAKAVACADALLAELEKTQPAPDAPFGTEGDHRI